MYMFVCACLQWGTLSHSGLITICGYGWVGGSVYGLGCVPICGLWLEVNTVWQVWGCVLLRMSYVSIA